MTIRRIARDTEGIESLKLYAALTPREALGADLQDPARLEEFAERLRRGVHSSVQMPARLHGLRAEALFRAVLVALGDFLLLTDVDSGEPYFDDSDGPLKLPDCCVVDRKGERFLIEVKSAMPADPFGAHTISSTEMRGLRRYGELLGTPVAVAHYWTRWNIWTMVGLEQLKPRGSRYGINIADALVANTLARLGDRMIATRPPLTLTLSVEDIGKEARDRDTEQRAVRVTDARISVAGSTLHDDTEIKIAWFLLRFGDWEAEDPQIRMSDEAVQTIDISANPSPENLAQAEREGFATVGMLSSMYSRIYNELTLAPDGAVRELRHEPDPGELAALIPSDYWDRSDRTLPLWRFQAEPYVPAP